MHEIGSSKSDAFGGGAPAPAAQAPTASFAFGGAAPAPTPSFMPQTPQQQGPSMFSIGAGPSQPPKGRQIARARRTRK